MKRLTCLAGVLAAVILSTGCQTPRTKETPTPAPATGETAELTAAPVERKPDNSILHPSSGMRFPEDVGGFKRQSYLQSGARGLNFTCDYKFSADGADILATVTLYPAPSVTAGPNGAEIREARPGMADSEYQVEVKKILNSHPHTSVTEEKQFSLAQGVQEHVGHYVEFEYVDIIGGRLQPVTSRLYLFNNVDENWAVRFRLTFPKGYPAEKIITAFLTGLRWSLRSS